jgi:hypothetical protein
MLGSGEKTWPQHLSKGEKKESIEEQPSTTMDPYTQRKEDQLCSKKIIQQ